MKNKVHDCAACMVAACAMFAQGALAQAYPSKAVRFIVPGAAGGAYDVLARAISGPLAASFGQPVIVDNRATAGGIAGQDVVAKSPPDGYTLIMTGISQMVMNKFVYPNLPYDPVRDYASITQVAWLPVSLWVHESVPAKSLPELIAYAKANPGKLNYGSAGVGHILHLLVEMLSERTGMQMVHVPYKGVAPAQQDIIAGRLQVLMFAPNSAMLNIAREGRVRALASASEKRLPQLPDVPTFGELGIPNLDAAGWLAVSAPAGTPRPIVDRLNRDIGRAVASPEVTKVYTQFSAIPATGTPEQLDQLIATDQRAWGPLIAKLGIREE
jgi:tripartite-type tricarboxylate transporter receptor subunit TctC